MIARADCERAFRDAVAACDPARLVREALAGEAFDVGLAVGKAALGMARGAGPVARGLAVAPALDAAPLPLGWSARDAAHPVPDARSVAAGEAAIQLVRSAGKGDRVLALISGGASSLVECPLEGVSLERLCALVAQRVASGATIHEINALRTHLSAIKGGKLAAVCAVPITTLAISDVFDDDPYVIGSGPTIDGRGHTRVIPMRVFADAVAHALGLPRGEVPIVGDVAAVADELSAGVSWGEPTVELPADHGEGGRAQQLALELAKRLRGSDRSAFVAGSDGSDGPPPRDRPTPAGAYVDGATWDAIIAAGIDPQRALDRRDAGNALHAVGALFVTGPTGINHADIVVVG
jgi:glycerate 2-kinase